MAARSLRVHLLRLVLPPVAALLALGAVTAYYPSLEPASGVYDQALVDIGIALSAHIRGGGAAGGYRLELAPEVEQVLRADRLDTIWYRVFGPDGRPVAGELELGGASPFETAFDGLVASDSSFRGHPVRVVSMLVPCGAELCGVQVAETTAKRSRLAREVLVSSLFPELLIAAATLAILWFGLKRGLGPLERLSADLKARSSDDLRPIDAGAAPEETRPLVDAINDLLARVADTQRNQQRFLANAAHQLRTPLAGLQAHTELALAQPVPEECRAELAQVHLATTRTARLANQLLALARAEPGGRQAERFGELDLKALAGDAADEWVRRALEREIDLGFELAPARVRGDAFLLREALANLVHNALEYVPAGAHVTVRTGARGARRFLEVEDSGPGIAPAERGRVLERFYRAPGTPGVGSGLGLAIVQEIAAAHGAALEIGDGALGRGCRVRLEFPAPAEARGEA